MAKTRSRFRPHDPDSVRARFERVKTEALRKLDDEASRLLEGLRALERGDAAADDASAAPPARSRRRRAS